MPRPSKLANLRRARWESSRRDQDIPGQHLRIFVPLSAEETAAVLMVSLEQAGALRAHDPGYSLVDRRWISLC